MTHPEYTLRPATAADAEFLYALNKITLEEYVAQTWGSWDEEFQRAYFDEHFAPNQSQIICVGEELIGVITRRWEPTCVYLADFRIAPAWQRKGIGTALVLSLLNEARRQNLPVELQVLRVNPARRLYERLGFRTMTETETHYCMRLEP